MSAGVCGMTVSIVQPIVYWSGSRKVTPIKPALQRDGLLGRAFLELGHDFEHVLKGNREADADVVPLEAGRFAFAGRGNRDDDAHDTAVNSRQRSAVVDR